MKTKIETTIARLEETKKRMEVLIEKLGK